MSSDESFLAELFAALEQTRLDAVVVGSMAAILHGAPITTQDVDLLIRDTRLNRKKIEALAKAIGTPPPVQISELTSALRLKGAAIPVDLLFDRIAGNLSFEGIRARSIPIKVGQKAARVALLRDVIKSKEAAGRPKDLAQLPMLRDTLLISDSLAQK